MFFLYHAASAPTGNVIARALGMPHGEVPPTVQEDFLIRWGAQQRLVRAPRVVLNRADAIANAADKLQSLKMLEYEDIPVPPFSEELDLIEAPFLGRNRHHSRGTDIVLYMQHADTELFGEKDFYTQYVPTLHEYRVHVVRDKVIRVSQKLYDHTHDPIGARHSWIRNHENGWVFRSPTHPLSHYWQNTAIEAVHALGLDFGAVDLIVDEEGRALVLEVNTAPACSPRTARAYCEAFVMVAAPHGIALTLDAAILDELAVRDE